MFLSDTVALIKLIGNHGVLPALSIKGWAGPDFFIINFISKSSESLK